LLPLHAAVERAVLAAAAAGSKTRAMAADGQGAEGGATRAVRR
jgi:hypothetical protein